PFAVRDRRAEPASGRARRQCAPHGRSLLQGHRARAATGAAAGRPRVAQHERNTVMRVAVIDYGGANIGSVRYALDRLGVDSVLTSDADTIYHSERVILPGVGAAAVAMKRLQELDLVNVIRSLQTPLFGICLGMQLLFESSEEGDVDCLGLL